MKIIMFIIIPVLFLAAGAAGAAADVNAILVFNNYTHEELYVELSICDNCCTHRYDVYVRPHGSSIVDYWAHTASATYAACAFGEISGNFYGCIEGGIADYNNNVYFDYGGDPYLSGPSGLPAERFVFDNPYARDEVVVVGSHGHHYASVGCFIGSVSAQ